MGFELAFGPITPITVDLGSAKLSISPDMPPPNPLTIHLIAALHAIFKALRSFTPRLDVATHIALAKKYQQTKARTVEPRHRSPLS